jgi:hypothetical protein
VDESVDSAFTVILVMSELLCKELGCITLDVRELVSEVNFEVGRNRGLHVGLRSWTQKSHRRDSVADALSEPLRSAHRTCVMLYK